MILKIWEQTGSTFLFWLITTQSENVSYLFVLLSPSFFWSNETVRRVYPDILKQKENKFRETSIPLFNKGKSRLKRIASYYIVSKSRIARTPRLQRSESDKYS